MKNCRFTHKQLDDLALHFLLGPGQGSVSDRVSQYASEISDEDFPALIEYVLNFTLSEYLLWDEDIDEIRSSFIRAMRVNGFEVKRIDSSRYQVEPKFSPNRIQETKEEARTLLKKLDFGAVQGSLDVAETLYVKGEYAKSLWNSRKALEDLMRLISQRLDIDQKEFLARYVESRSARELISKINDYACKGHETEIPEYEAIFGYHLVISAIYHLLLLLDSFAT
jgi:hypothetical protein